MRNRIQFRTYVHKGERSSLVAGVYAWKVVPSSDSISSTFFRGNLAMNRMKTAIPLHQEESAIFVICVIMCAHYWQSAVG